MKTKIKTDEKERLYVIPFKHGRRESFSCLGFDRAFEKGTEIADWLAYQGVWVEFPKEENIGKVEGYREYEVTVEAARIHFERTKRRCPIELCTQLIGLEGKRIEVIDAYGETRRFYVGKSTGWIPCHLEIARIDSSGGPAVVGAPFRSVRLINTPARTG